MKNLTNSHSMLPRNGFTLVELLVVTMILGVVGSAVVACLVGGIRAWDTVRSFGGMELKTLTGIEIMEKDLENSFEFDGITFEGNETEMSFAAPVIDASNDEDSYVPNVSTVKYQFDSNSGSLRRRTWRYSENVSESDATDEVLIYGLKDVAFEYFYYVQDESGRDDGGWRSGKGAGTNYIGGVRVNLKFPDDKNFVEIKRTIMFPVIQMVSE